ncbi:hypothetical protein D3C77_551970 [compost metagenome]
MRTWEREGYKVVEVEFDYDLHQFDVIQDGEIAASINPADLDAQAEVITALDSGEDVNGWEDGNGHTISIEKK